MRVLYVANHGNGGNDDEGAIKWALEQLGHTVITYPERGTGYHQLKKIDADILLFHKWDDFDCIKKLEMKKVFWYFDKVEFGTRKPRVERAINVADYAFLTDGTYVAKHPREWVKTLRQGFDTRKTHWCDPVPVLSNYKLGFAGNVYDGRGEFMQKLKERYSLRIFNGFHGDNLRAALASIPIFVAPPFPSDDQYWSNRVYLLTGCGGFLMHPRLEGLEACYQDRKEIVFFDTMDELYELIDYYLIHNEEREAIRYNGYIRTINEYSYIKRCQILLHTVQNSIGRPV